jgi:NAD(P)-dependent dehydrogenase (short-subunit alcohol dehydrogenase family)
MKKAALITGASSGIGAATARLFSQNGYFIYLLGRNEERLTSVALECTSGASLLKCDLASAASIEKYTKHVLERTDTDLQVLVNNAGMFTPGKWQETPIQSWREQFETNLFGTIAFTQKILPLFMKRKKGSIVNVASTLGIRSTIGTGAYSAGKAAMISWSNTMALELGPSGIRVNAIAPGLVNTPIHKGRDMSELNSLQPLGRVGTPEEIAKSIYFLGSDDSSWTTGAVLSVDGGINLT